MSDHKMKTNLHKVSIGDHILDHRDIWTSYLGIISISRTQIICVGNILTYKQTILSIPYKPLDTRKYLS